MVEQLSSWICVLCTLLSSWHSPFFFGHSGNVRNFAFSPDGKRIASTGDDQTLRIWEVCTRREVCQRSDVREDLLYFPDSVCFSPNGRWIAASNTSETIWIWDANNGKLYRKITNNLQSQLSFTPDSQLLVLLG